MYDFYRENILDHDRNMRYRGVLDPADIDYEAVNPLCGDKLRLTLRLSEDKTHIEALAWEGEGCAISKASASMLGEMILGKSLDEVRAISKQDVFDLIGIPLSMNRVKCGLLSLKALTVALYGLGEWERREQAEED
ncbi:MAG: iron-sulfur cluster assembly scaffold protein [Pleurocapsa minor GSE-CHR-MK-17-07R]|jgi:nitrogen fixation NifU-like protein|nr:iron-sulfur cluster assembly scaffold protein [Pleurocapsa minor GSE-CHR-MK 17-07R]